MKKLINFFLICFFITVNLYSQELRREELIASYIYNFAKNIHWPNEEMYEKFNILIIGDDKNIIREMNKLAGTKTLKEKAIIVTSTTTLTSIDDAQVVFLLKEYESKLTSVFDRIENKNILLITDQSKEVRLIMINFYNAENGTLKFEINKANIINQQLSLDADIVLLGGTEIDIASLYKEGQKSLRDLQKNIDQLEKITSLQKKYIQQQRDSVSNQRIRITEQLKLLETQSQLLKVKENELGRMNERLLEQQKQLNKNSELLQKKEKELLKQVQSVKKQELRLDSLNNELTKQKEEFKRGNEYLRILNDKIVTQEKVLKEKGTLIRTQQYVLLLVIVISLLAILLVFSVYKGYKNKKALTEKLENLVEERTNALKITNEELIIELEKHKLTENKLKQSEEQFRLISENVADMIVMLDLNGKRIYSNPSYKPILGDTKQLIGTDSFKEIHPDDREKIKNVFDETVRTGKGQQAEYRLIGSDGSIHFIESQGSVVKNNKGEITNVVVISRDITERKKIEEELKIYRENLEELVKQRTAELIIAKEKAESADRLKSAFLATMSHELRTPLNSIIGFTGILMKGIAGPLNDEQMKQLSMAKGSAQHLLALINDVLDISKIEAGELVVSIRQFEFNKSIKKVCDIIKPLAEKKNLSLLINIPSNPIIINSDEKRVEQIILNLLNNAVKFTENGYVKIDCQLSDNKIIASVIDTGMGIKNEDMDILFKPFRQINSGLTRTHEGTGLGLSISKKLTEKLGGTLTVESEFGVGSTFSLILPIGEQN